MRIVRVEVSNFRCIEHGILYPDTHNVLLGPNNLGKSAVLDALDLLLNPELGGRYAVIDENDFYRRNYRAPGQAVVGDDATTGQSHDSSEGAIAAAPDPRIEIEAVICDLSADDRAVFADVLVPWKAADRVVVESAPVGSDPFSGAVPAIRVRFEAWYDADEDDFESTTIFRADPRVSTDDSPKFTKTHKRRIGFLIYRDFRALQRPITLQPFALFAKLLLSQDATPRHFDDVLERIVGAGAPLFGDPQFARAIAEYRQELARYLPLSDAGSPGLRFELTDRTRAQTKEALQLYIDGDSLLPLQKMGAGTRSIAILAILLLIARRRGRGIIALEEPETFLFPHAQRRVVAEALSIATQTFVTTHSPIVVECMPIAGLHRLVRTGGEISMRPVAADLKAAREVRSRFRKQLAEVLLGTSAIVVEEESAKLWLLRASELLQGSIVDGVTLRALELAGTGVVAAEGNGDIAKLARLLGNAGLAVEVFIDQVDPAELNSMVSDPGLHWTFHKYRGLEDLLTAELPPTLLRRILSEAEYTRHRPPTKEVAGWSDEELVTKAREFLIQYKGYLPFQQWMLDQVTAADVPPSFAAFLAYHARGRESVEGSCCSVLP